LLICGTIPPKDGEVFATLRYLIWSARQTDGEVNRPKDVPTGAKCVYLLANWQVLYQILGKSKEKFRRLSLVARRSQLTKMLVLPEADRRSRSFDFLVFSFELIFAVFSVGRNEKP
jgi:hypothetical protein